MFVKSQEEPIHHDLYAFHRFKHQMGFSSFSWMDTLKLTFHHYKAVAFESGDP